MALDFQLSPVCSAVTRAPAPLGHRRKPARLIVPSSPAAPCAQERAPQASRLLPSPPSGTRCGRAGWVGGHVSIWPGLLLSHQPLPLGGSVSCRSPAARLEFHPTPRSPSPSLLGWACAPGPRQVGTMALEGLPTPKATQAGSGGGGGVGPYCLSAGLELSVWRWGSRKHICNAICWPGARADP